MMNFISTAPARYVEVSRYNNNGKKIIVGKAVFHQFSKDFEEFENGGCEFATAIVEYEDGTVDNVPVEMIRFLNE